jgi:hypothetical protein
VILRIQDTVDGDNCGANGHHNENEEHDQHKAVHVVKLVGPECSEDEIHFNENGAKGKQSYSGNNKHGI